MKAKILNHAWQRKKYEVALKMEKKKKREDGWIPTQLLPCMKTKAYFITPRIHPSK